MSWSLNCDWILSLSVSKSISSSCASGPRNDFNLHLCTLNGGQLYSQNRRWQSGQWVFSLLHILIGSPHRELHSLIFYCTTLLNTYQRGGQLHKSLEVADDSNYHPRPYNQGLFRLHLQVLLQITQVEGFQYTTKHTEHTTSKQTSPPFACL